MRKWHQYKMKTNYTW